MCNQKSVSSTWERRFPSFPHWCIYSVSMENSDIILPFIKWCFWPKWYYVAVSQTSKHTKLKKRFNLQDFPQVTNLSSILLWSMWVVSCLFFDCIGSSLWHTSLEVAAHRLNCPVACGILVFPPGIEPASSALEGGFLTAGPPGKSPHVDF